ncbi:hypothetical protein PHYSODRAFT_339685 [Phytophthora sojae]|uniref:Retrotransposon gag domain-containing protein n=1 Tax=Phytophthora sojae (strain P6497) TaxID=1094619 RepID=G5A5F5_PHYSP|nr:hypothetical protein PHYSODRAFT_339685 [Phytophthora sojae]EGZ09339.1 hypothetical protein PHYSODRAFT_339685 [Phytophthora sojae]|eukprot:XP_009535972.1 hypothetical protein PHYSODRAFT_339685 [Phytophthora sojae]
MKKKMATGSQSAVPATPMKSGGTRGDDSTAVLITPQPGPIAERNVSFDEPMTGSDAKDEEMDEEYDDYLEEKAPAVVTPETPEDAAMSAGRSGGSRSLARSVASELEDDAPPISRNLADELDDVDGPEPAYDDMEEFEDRADDSRSPVLTTQVTEQTSGNRPPMNGGTPAANKPRMIRQAVWADLSHQLARPVNAVTVEQVAKDTPKAARINKGGADPARVPLPRTPKKTERNSHMVTPPATTRTDRVARGAEDSKVTRSSLRSTGRSSSRKSRYADDSSDDDDDFTGDGGAQMDEYLRQIREVSHAETVNPTPRLEVAMHRPLGQIPTFSGACNRSENSMQWLRAFVYEMKGTHAPPNEWCMPFKLRLRDGAVHWHRQLTKKTKRTWTLLSEAFIRYYCSQFSQSAETRYYSAKRDDKEHVCDYLNRLNGYARNAGVQFENGGRKAKDHLERRLAPLRIKDIHELEEMIIERLKVEERQSSGESSQSRSKAREPSRRRDDRRPDDSRRRDDRRRQDTRDGYRRDDSRTGHSRGDRRERDYERRRDDSRNVPRVTLADASVEDIVAELQGRDARSTSTGRDSARQQFNDDSDAASDQGSDDSWYSEEGRHDGYSSDDSDHYVAAANESERRAAADGTYARSDNRPPRRDRSGREPSRDNRYQSRGGHDNRQHQYGPCAACGGLSHSAHFCNRRCQLCKQVYDAGRCEVFQELTKLVRNKPAVEAECVYAFVGKCEWPDEGRGTWVNVTEFEKERGEGLGGGDLSEKSDDEVIEDTAEDWMTSAVQETSRRRLDVEKFDRRVRMRTLVNGAVNDSRTRILLDSGANVGVISEKYANQLRIKDIPGHGRCMEVQGITKGKATTTRRASVKTTLGWERVYVFETWIIDHNAGVNVVLGTDFMIPAGIRLDLFNAATKLPDEVTIPLIKTQNMVDEAEGVHVNGGPVDVLQIPGRDWKEFRLQRKRPSPTTHAPWIRRTNKLIPTVKRFHKGRPQRIRLTNIDTRLTICSAHTTFVVWYREWQVLAYEAARDKTLLKREAKLYAQWLAGQPSAQISELFDSDGGEDSDGLPMGNDPEPSSLGPGRSSQVAPDDTPADPQVAEIAPDQPSITQFPTVATNGDTPDLKPHCDLTNEAPTTHLVPRYDAHTPLAMAEHTFMSVMSVLGMDEGDATNDSAWLPTGSFPTTPTASSLSKTRLPKSHTGCVVSFAGLTQPGQYGADGSCAWIVWRLPEWKLMVAANAYLADTTSSLAQSAGMTYGVLAALQLGADDLVVVSNSRLVLLHSLGAADSGAMTQPSYHEEEYNAAADSLASEALESQTSKVVLSGDRKAALCELNQLQAVIYKIDPDGISPQNVLPGDSFRSQDFSSSSSRSIEPTMAAPMTPSQAKLKTKPPIRTGKTMEPLPTTGECEFCANSAGYPENGQTNSTPRSRVDWVSRIWPCMERGKETDGIEVSAPRPRQLNLTVNCAWGNAAQEIPIETNYNFPRQLKGSAAPEAGSTLGQTRYGKMVAEKFF